MKSKTKFNALVIYAHIEGISPPIWRRFLVQPELSLASLHDILQIAMDWHDTHFHDFRQGKGKAIRLLASPETHDLQLSDDDFDLPDEDDVTVEEVFARKGSSITYVYNYEEEWKINLRLEDRANDSGFLPRCTGGERNGPPENCGGIAGYNDCIDAIKSKSSGSADKTEDWNPEFFDEEEINKYIKNLSDEESEEAAGPTVDLMDFLVDPGEYGISPETMLSYVLSSKQLFPLLNGINEVAGILHAPDAGINEGVLVLSENQDELTWAIALFECVEDYHQATPGEPFAPRRVLMSTFVRASFMPDAPDTEPGDSDGVFPVPTVLLDENISPPNQEEIELITACISLLIESISQSSPDEALPPPHTGNYTIGDRIMEISFVPDADLYVRDQDDEMEGMTFYLGYDEDDEETDENEN